MSELKTYPPEDGGDVAFSDLSGYATVEQGGTNNPSLGVDQGTVYYGDGSKLVGLAPDTDGKVLTTHGSGANPTWETASGGAVESVSNVDGTLTISPTTGSVIASIASSAALPGNPTTSTQDISDNSTKIATTAFVKSTSQFPIPSPWSIITTSGQNTATLNSPAGICPSATVFSDGTISTTLRGNPIYSTNSDSCYGDQLVQSQSGDFTLIAQVCSFRDNSTSYRSNTQYSGPALVVRQGNTNSDKYYVIALNALVANAVNGSANMIVYSQYTATTSGSGTQSSATANITLPVWLKLVGSSGDYSTYYSTDGTNWTQIGATASISFSGSFNVGLGSLVSGVAANDAGSIETTWRNVSLTNP